MADCMISYVCMTDRRGQWLEWLTADEQREWEQLERELEERKEAMLMVKAKRDRLRYRAMNRRYVVNGRD